MFAALGEPIMSLIRLLMPAILPAMLFAATPSLAQALPTEASLRAIDQEQRRLVKEGDAEGLDKILHPAMLINGPDGRVVTREMFLQSTRTGAIAKESFERVPEAVRITGNVGVLVGHENIVAAPGSRDFAKFGKTPFQRRYINIFLFEGGRWLFLARQASIIPPAK
jgi:hypothetical protein